MANREGRWVTYGGRHIFLVKEASFKDGPDKFSFRTKSSAKIRADKVNILKRYRKLGAKNKAARYIANNPQP